MKSFSEYVGEIRRIAHEGRGIPVGQPVPRRAEKPAPDAGTVLIFSPHPDDECITGALPLRLRHDCGMRIVNVAVTLGSRKDRRDGRLEELRASCGVLGFGLVETQPGGLEHINREGKAGRPAEWAAAVSRIESILRDHQPTVILLPHGADANTTHIGTHDLVLEGLARMPSDWDCLVVLTEFWHPLANPNLMVAVPPGDLVLLMEALSQHVGEIERNPYHLTLPFWMRDNVRRGGELVGTQGGAAPAFDFAVLYRVEARRNGALCPAWDGGRILSEEDDAGLVLQY